MRVCVCVCVSMHIGAFLPASPGNNHHGACSPPTTRPVPRRSQVVFRGAVQVPHGSDNTTANQLCRSLLLSDSARVDISPNLEILTDDVVCTHGATVADLDDEMVFYLQAPPLLEIWGDRGRCGRWSVLLQARGLGRAEARVLLLEGWARSLMGEVPSEAATRRVAAKAAGLAREGAAREVRKQAMSSI